MAAAGYYDEAFIRDFESTADWLSSEYWLNSIL